MKKTIAVICTLILVIGLAGCGNPEEKYHNVSFELPKHFVRSDVKDYLYMYNNKSEEFTSSISILIYEKEDFVYGKTSKEEMDGYIKAIRSDTPVIDKNVSVKNTSVDFQAGKVIQYKWDYSKSEDPEQQAWGISFFTEVLIPVGDHLYIFEYESIKKDSDKGAFDDFLRSVEFDDHDDD